MYDSSYGPLPGRDQGDCSAPPDIAIFYPGTDASVPVISAGTLVFKGASSKDLALGIGFTGYTIGNEFSINLDSILKGGSGVKLRCCSPSLKKLVRLRCCEENCEQASEDIHIMFQYVSTCKNPLDYYDWAQPVDVYETCGCVESCCQKLTRAAKQINADKNSPVVATYNKIGEDHFLDLEAKEAGVNFDLSVWEGFADPVTLVPYFEQNFTASTIKHWFIPEVLSACDPDRCLAILELWFKNDELYDDGAGSVTSNPGSTMSKLETKIRRVSCVFDPDAPASVTAFNALKTILTGTTERDKLLVTTTCEDFPIYYLCVTRADTGEVGDPANLDAVKAAYPTGLLSASRVWYDGVNSYYTLKTTSSVVPAGAGTDVVVAGPCGASNLPCGGAADDCPEVESSCLGC